MRKDFLGRGWKFPFQFDRATGGVEYGEFEQNIKDCITIILGTKPGERQMLPNFGCRIHELMYSANTQATAVMAAGYVKEALVRWEPRIDVTKVDAWPDDQGKLQVQVHYKIKSTMTEQELSLLLTGG